VSDDVNPSQVGPSRSQQEFVETAAIGIGLIIAAAKRPAPETPGCIRPAVVIVPTMAFPLAVPFTFQTTVVLLEFRTVAPNGWLSPIASVAEVGTTATLMAAGASCAPTVA
jgi:hypothetical protein